MRWAARLGIRPDGPGISFRRRSILGGMFRKRGRTAAVLPGEWRSIVETRVGLWPLVSDEEQERWGGLIAAFVPSVRWEGAGGLEVTDEHRVVIAAQASLLVLARDLRPYRRIGAVVVYPRPVVKKGTRGVGGGVVSDSAMPIHGETRPGGPVVVVWSAAAVAARHPARGRDVVLHEFAHQLDFDGGALDGMPRLGSLDEARAWQRTIDQVYARLVSEGDAVLGNYAATNTGELFAVATERFFGRPAALAEAHPELYGLLCGYYQQDPLSRLEVED